MSDLFRRLVTIPLYGLLFVVASVTLPLTLPLAALVDRARGTPLGAARSILFFTFYLSCEVLGILACLGLGLARRWPGVSAERSQGWYFSLQSWWARALLRGAERILGFRVEAAGDESVGGGPMLLFVRHASVADTVLPAVLLSDRYGLRLRYVLKRELLWDPCMDLAGHRTPNVFIHRNSGQSAREIARVRELAADLREGEGVLIYPEGTRFTEAKRERILERLATADPGLAARAAELRHVLPPRAGGPLALLEASPQSDVVFCVHAGFDGVTRFSQFLDGALVGRRVRVEFWRVPAAQLPVDTDERLEWLFTQWARVDDWVATQLKDGAAAAAP